MAGVDVADGQGVRVGDLEGRAVERRHVGNVGGIDMADVQSAVDADVVGFRLARRAG